MLSSFLLLVLYGLERFSPFGFLYRSIKDNKKEKEGTFFVSGTVLSLWVGISISTTDWGGYRAMPQSGDSED